MNAWQSALRHLASTLGLGIVLLAAVASPSVARAQSKTDWMRDVFGGKANQRLLDVCIPGTHDSGTKEIDSKSPYAKDISKATYGVSESLNAGSCYILDWAGVACEGTKLVAEWAKAHEDRIDRQLEAGYRYFDLRVTQRGDDKFAFIHSLINADGEQQLNDELDDIARFLEQHPKEIVILDFQRLLNFDDPKYWGQLNKMISDRLSSRILRTTGVDGAKLDLATLTFNDFWSRGKQVLVLVQTHAKSNDDDDQYTWHTVAAGDAFMKDHFYWTRSDHIISGWANTDSYDTMIKFLRNGKDGDKPVGIGNADRGGKWFVSQMVLTPTVVQIGAGTVNGVDSLLGLAKTLNSHQVKDIADLDALARQNPNGSSRVNIVVTDSYKTSNVWSGCMARNSGL